MEKNEKGYIVRLSENAVISMVLNGLEAYATRNKNTGKRGLETYGNLFGHQVILKDGQVLYQIDIANIDVSSRQNKRSVDYNKEAIRLKIDTISSFWPNLEYIGDFHTHPYTTYTEVEESKGYYFSDGDREDLSKRSEFWIKMGYKVGLVLAIGSMEKRGTRPPQYINKYYNTVEITLGNFRLWLTAYCVYEEEKKLKYTKDKDESVTLDCPALTGLLWEHTEFGRAKIGKEVKYKPSELLQ